MDIFRIANKLKEPQTIIQQKEGRQNAEQISQAQKGRMIEEKESLPFPNL
ncbi:hypothetical protein SCRDD08_00253 [Streptococcus cristatus]|uniref:Uncharacterized protein n=1 Tax=Streptococcus cristatus TaxID=45634 RepID=A0A139N4U6_STRCR|nr:hypothetical protein SCRDD08_00253 [Streptococcus cristatus]